MSLPGYQGVATSQRAARDDSAPRRTLSVEHARERRPATTRMGERLIALSMSQPDSLRRGDARALDQIGSQILACARSDDGWRCGSPLCPRCQARNATRFRRTLERELHELPRGQRIAHATLTTGADAIVAGHRLLVRSFAMLRRRACWADVVDGGHLHVEILPAVGGSRRWNVHLHALVWLREAVRRLDERAVRDAWAEIVSAHDVPGSARVTPIARRFVPDRAAHANAHRGA